MRGITFISICMFLIFMEVISAEELRLKKRSLCASNCRNKCRDNNDCNTNCDSKCSSGCNRRCRNSEDCQPAPTDCEVEPEEKTKETIILPPSKQGESISKNINHLDNDHRVDINPNITMTNTITNVNNISVPINVKSVNVNTIRVTSTDTVRTDTNITSSPVNCSSSGGQEQGCNGNQKRIVIIPYPFQRPRQPEIQEIVPPIQSQRIENIAQQPIMIAPPIRPVIMPHQFLPPVQRQEMVIPIPISAPVQTPEYFQTIVRPQIYTVPEPVRVNQQQQFMWYPRQQMISQQEFIPQQQNLLPIQQTMLPISLSRPCSSSFPNSPCSAQPPVYYSEPCTTSDCMNRFPYVMTSPYHPINGLPQFSNNNQFSQNADTSGNKFMSYLNRRPLPTSQDSNRI